MSPRPLILAACAALVGCRSAPLTRDGPPFRYPEARCGKAELKYRAGVPVLTVEGTPEEIGEAVGALAVRPAPEMVGYPQDLLRHFHAGCLYTAFVAGGRKMVEHFPDDYRRELEAIARGGGVERDRVVVGNTLFDLKKILACSALLVEPGRSATGAPLLGRNLDYPSLGYAHEYSLVTVYRPEGKHAFASVGFPGLVGCLSGMNDAGLALAVLEVFQVPLGFKRLDASGTPYALCYRRLLEECSTIEEARELLGSMHRTTITNLVLADRRGVAVFEVTPEYVLVRGPEGGTCVCANHYCTEPLRPLWPRNDYRTLDRYRALREASERPGPIGVEDLQRGLHAACHPTGTLQTMVFEPATLRLHLAVGERPASAGKMATLELGPLLGARAR